MQEQKFTGCNKFVLLLSVKTNCFCLLLLDNDCSYLSYFVQNFKIFNCTLGKNFFKQSTLWHCQEVHVIEKEEECNRRWETVTVVVQSSSLLVLLRFPLRPIWPAGHHCLHQVCLTCPAERTCKRCVRRGYSALADCMSPVRECRQADTL